MPRAVFFVLVVACGGASRPTTVEIAQPLPSPEPQPTTTATLAPTPPPPIATDDVGDPRPAPRESRAMLESEARALEALVAATSTASPDLPMLLFRTAETYVELRKLGATFASAKAIGHYVTVAQRFPRFAKGDAVQLGLGLEYVATGDLMAARRAFYDLIKSWPQSRFVPYSYFEFGDMFQREAKNDPSKWDFAKQAYVEVMKYAQSPITPEAICRASEVATAQGDSGRAAALRAQLARDFPSSPAASRCGGP